MECMDGAACKAHLRQEAPLDRSVEELHVVTLDLERLPALEQHLVAQLPRLPVEWVSHVDGEDSDWRVAVAAGDRFVVDPNRPEAQPQWTRPTVGGQQS